MAEDEPKDDAGSSMQSREDIEAFFVKHLAKERELSAVDQLYQSVLTSIEDELSQYPRLDWKKASSLEKTLVHNGGLQFEIKGRILNWVTGLPALFLLQDDNIISAIAGHHQSLRSDLYEIVMDQYEDYEMDAVHDRALDPRDAKGRGADIASYLPIPDREYLAQPFIDKVLRPYLRASHKAQRILREQIEAAHRRGQFLIFAREADRSFGMLLPGGGFDRLGSYAIPRDSYIKGFGYSEDEVDRRLKPKHTPPFDPSELRFLLADQIPEFCVEDTEHNGGSKRIGRPKGSGLFIADTPFLAEMHALISDGRARSRRDAAIQVFDRHASRISGGGSRDSKITRLSVNYKKFVDAKG